MNDIITFNNFYNKDNSRRKPESSFQTIFPVPGQINEVHERKSRALNFSTSLADRDRNKSGDHKASSD